MTTLKTALQTYDAAPNEKERHVVMVEAIKPAIQRLLNRRLGVDAAYWLMGLTSDGGIREACQHALETAFYRELDQLHHAVQTTGITLTEAIRIVRRMHIHMYCRAVTDEMKVSCLDEILQTVRYVQQTWKDELESEERVRQATMLAHCRASAGTKHAELDAEIIT